MNITERFPLLFAGFSGNTYYSEQRVGAALANLENGMREGFIRNTDFVAAKDIFGRMVETAWEKIRHNNQPLMMDQPQHIRDFTWDIAFVNGGIAGFYRTTTKRLAKAPTDEVIQPFVAIAKQFMNEIQPIAAAFEFFRDKTKIIKRQPKSEEEKKAAFAPPPVTMESSKRVKELLEQVVAEEYESLYENILAGREKEVSYYAKYLRDAAEDTSKKERPRVWLYANKNKYADVHTLQRVVTFTNAGDVIVDNYKDILIEMSRQDANDIREAYIIKNLRKIVSVLEGKEKQGASLVSADIVGRNNSLGRFTGTFRVTFSDGSGFTFTNSVVYAYSVHNKLFMRYPLTFHNVLLAGGVKMGRPSEERMNTVFLGLPE